MKMRGLPGMFAPRYQELQLGAVYMVPSATSFTWAAHSVSESASGSMCVRLVSRSQMMQSPIQFTCCSMATSMLQSTEGLPGPVTVNRLGKPRICRPR